MRTLVLLEPTSNSRHFVDQYFASHGLLLKSSIELGSHDLLLEAAKNNLGKACVIKEFSQKNLIFKTYMRLN